jgi:ankyrin repeat protein
MYASMFGRFDVVQLLVFNGADIHIKDNQGMTALHHSAAGLFRKPATVKSGL